ncbi:adenosylcobinamide-phosphate synthase CbiB [Massilia soli]|uniref:Cobalamin biosynthesis protein CobD n=1 Tax=Massilia soli TaxID=2792854 RepID=A0ABS7SUI9_9BURK|nr:adenosylcobinamide-phosphate synthase CbiB [Massilia soli]MBZ2209626.1 adenosylcobinamide-phosphate synthase CbiB [Massilia soli]
MLSGLTLFDLAWLTAAAVALDMLLGEPRRWHPLIGFGNLSSLLERALNRGRALKLRGMLAWLLAVAPLVALSAWLADAYGAAIHLALLYFSLGLRSLHDHNLPIARALLAWDISSARLLTARIVSRDTTELREEELAKASVESLLENGNDAVFGTLFWFAVAGGPGALMFRLANTLDAMWGYKTARFLRFGWMAARFDDLVNLPAARLTALSYVALAEDSRRALRCWRVQAPAWSSPNAGPVMASGAGALGVLLGGSATYDGVLEQRPVLGAGKPPAAHDIERAWKLVVRTTILWLALMAFAAIAAHLSGAHHA